jgi:phytoene synthase
VPTRRRAAVAALWRLDVALGNALAGGREPMISRIKLAWWREALEKLDREKAPSEPVLQALAEHVLPFRVTGAELSGMEAGWEILLRPDPLTREDLRDYARARGGLLFRLTARLLGDEEEAMESPGSAWALVDLARHSGNEADREAALEAARAFGQRRRWRAPLRPLGMLVVLAARDAEPARPQWEEKGSPARMWRMLRHRLTGSSPF